MERPVQSFKSFVRTLPPPLNPSAENDKPLPPTPSSDQSLPPLLSSPLATSTESTWKAPTEWEWDNPSPPSQVPTTSIFTARNYSLLIPEPSPGLSSMQIGSNSWSFEANAPQYPLLQPIRERSKSRPNTPPRNPSRPSPLYTPSVETYSASNISLPDPFSSIAVSQPDMLSKKPLPDSPVELQIQNTVTPSSDFAYEILDASTKAKAYASLVIGSPRNTKAVWEDWSNNANAPHAESGTSTVHSLRGNKLPPLTRRSPTVEDEMNETEFSDKMQLLSFSHDYHNVLADQYHQSNSHPGDKLEWTHLEMTRPMVPSQEQGLMPEPLAWRTGPDDEAVDNFSAQTPSNGQPPLQSRKKHQTIASWTSLCHLHGGSKKLSADGDVLPRSTSDPSVAGRKPIPNSEADRVLKGNKLMPSILSHTKGLMPNKRRAKDMGVASPGGYHAPASRLPAATPPVEHRSPFIRLPEGFALVRNSPSITAHSETPSIHDISLLDGSQRSESFAGSPVSASDHPWRLSSWYSQHSQAELAPAMTVNQHIRSSFGSLPSRHSRSDNSSPPASPLAHEIPLPFTPPLFPSSPPRNAKIHFTSSPLANDDNKHPQPDRMNEITDEEFFGGSIFNKARDMRDAWKRHQRDAKHDKLKQSIRVLGHTDPTVAARYVKREGRRCSDERDTSGRMPGYMVMGPV